MTKVTITEDYLEDIADAIRSKNGSSNTYTPAQMAPAIQAIPTGGGGGGVDPSDATATAADILSPKTAYIASGKTTGTISTITLPTSATTTNPSVTNKATIGRSTSTQYIKIDKGYNAADAQYTISATANGSATPQATISSTGATITTGTNALTLSKTVSNTPNVTAGYISSGTAGNSSVSLTANVTINPTLTASNATVTAPVGYYTTAGTKTISSGTVVPASSITGTSANVSIGSGTVTLTKTISNTPNVSTAGYISAGTAGNSSISLTGSLAIQHYYTGTSTPSSSLGENGDIYLKTS
ncbi:MAG: hypothetical protein J6T34_04165 [Bacilli bacterium]|nr:hypothetical protein [Bacilli bacterium]